MIEAILLGVAVGGLGILAAGVRRLPWKYAALVGLGFGLVIFALRLAYEAVDPFLPVWLAAGGGMLWMMGSERGERERARRSAEILGRSADQSPSAGS